MNSSAVLQLLRGYESRNVTFMDPQGGWPIVWQRARGAQVWDAEGREYLDLTAAFGVAAAGHCNRRVVAAGQRQMCRLMHAMGDVHPHELKARLARELSRLTFERWEKGSRGKTIFCNSGFEAVEAGLKTALLATGRPRVIAFEGAYHGLGYGALTTTHRRHFREPFRRQLREFASFAPFPKAGAAKIISSLKAVTSAMDKIAGRARVGAVLVEPIQARGGINIPPPGFLKTLRRWCDAHGALLIVDEIYTGFGRTGKWFACEHEDTVPDVLCLGKALTGGFPLSACVGRANLMDAAWPSSSGEAIHTSTFLGNPVGCAMALANVEEISSRDLINRSAEMGESLLRELKAGGIGLRGYRLEARGAGLMAGLEIRMENGEPATEAALEAIKTMLQRGYILLPEGAHGNVISFTPPLTIQKNRLRKAVAELFTVLSG